MGIATNENIVTTVGAILKSLECPICLELLKTPVSAGCGHFFCKHCVSGILQSKYRAPCPLCKRSFTRRSVQTAAQRQSVISAARTLAETCSILTGFNFRALDSSVKDASRSDDEKTLNPSKKFRASKKSLQVFTDNHISKQQNEQNSFLSIHIVEKSSLSCFDGQQLEKTENVPSRKRKSVDTEEVERSKQKSDSEAEIETRVEPAQDDVSSKKRACSRMEFQDEDSEDLPSLEDVFSQSLSKSPITPVVEESLSKIPLTSVVNVSAAEKPLSIFPTDRFSGLKTYSAIHRKKENVSSVESKLAETKEGYNDYFISNKKAATHNIESSPKSNRNVQSKNKIKALKNKTNEVHTEKIIREKDSTLKLANAKNPVEITESLDKSKENEIVSSPSAPPSTSSAKVKQPGIKKLRKSKKRNQLQSQNSSSVNIPSNLEHENSLNLDEVALPSAEWEKQSEKNTEIHVEDPFKSIGLTDTAISVDTVRSPMAAKALSLLKSPGWSRVKEVKKDFKVKKFTSLHVEKNSPNITFKNVHGQEPNHGTEIPELSTTVQKCKSNKSDSVHENEAMEMDTPLSPEYERSTDQESGQQLIVSEGKNTLIDKLNSHNVNVLEPINSIKEFDSHMEVDKQINAASGNMNNSENIQDTKSLNNNVAVAETNTGSPKFPTVSITANSMICANFTDSTNKISKHNVMKAKKIVCEVPNSTIFDNDVTKKGDILSKFIQDNCSEVDNVLFNNPAEIEQCIVPSQIAGYQSFQAHSVINEDDGFQYVEQSQQTSQMFNFDLQNCVLNNPNPLIQPCILPNQAGKEKTKVIKRTCLTLDEIQDCFLKSSQSNCSETLCSVPFLDGLFKLHIGVSDDTLNVSVLKVVQSTSEIHNAHSSLMNKYIQTTNSLLSPILPSSNPGSESSQPDSSANPFPNLNKVSGSKHDFSHSVEKCVVENESSCVPSRKNLIHAETSPKMQEPSSDKLVDQLNSDDEITENNMDMSEIIHFPPELPQRSENLPQKCPESSKVVQQTEGGQVMKNPVKEDVLSVEQSPLKTDHAIIGYDLPEEEHMDIPEKEDINVPEKEHIDVPEKKHVYVPEKEHVDVPEKDHMDVPEKEHMDVPEKEHMDVPEKEHMDVPEKEHMDVPPVKESKSLFLDSEDFSNSDEEFDLKKLEKCVQAPKGEGKKVSRLSLKKRSVRSKVLESSDESDLENHDLGAVNKSVMEVNKNGVVNKLVMEINKSGVTSKSIMEVDKSVSIKSNKTLKHTLSTKSMYSQILDKEENLKNTAKHPSPREAPSTFNSILSEDVTETNASEIILEIEDLADKIKSLEEKLKQCGHTDNQKSLLQTQHSKCQIVSDESDSEDSFDLFSESVPPTPPSRV